MHRFDINANELAVPSLIILSGDGAILEFRQQKAT